LQQIRLGEEAGDGCGEGNASILEATLGFRIAGLDHAIQETGAISNLIEPRPGGDDFGRCWRDGPRGAVEGGGVDRCLERALELEILVVCRGATVDEVRQGTTGAVIAVGRASFDLSDDLAGESVQLRVGQAAEPVIHLGLVGRDRRCPIHRPLEGVT